MVNDPFRALALSSPRRPRHAKQAPTGERPSSLDLNMPSSKPLMTSSSGPTPDSVESALRTLETESGGINALAAALRGPLGATFAKAVDLIRNAKGRLIITADSSRPGPV